MRHTTGYFCRLFHLCFSLVNQKLLLSVAYWFFYIVIVIFILYSLIMCKYLILTGRVKSLEGKKYLIFQLLLLYVDVICSIIYLVNILNNKHRIYYLLSCIIIIFIILYYTTTYTTSWSILLLKVITLLKTVVCIQIWIKKNCNLSLN